MHALHVALLHHMGRHARAPLHERWYHVGSAPLPVARTARAPLLHWPLLHGAHWSTVHELPRRAHLLHGHVARRHLLHMIHAIPLKVRVRLHHEDWPLRAICNSSTPKHVRMPIISLTPYTSPLHFGSLGRKMSLVFSLCAWSGKNAEGQANRIQRQHMTAPCSQ